MKRQDKIINYIAIPSIVFLFAFVLRRYFFCGFILGDDGQEFALLNQVTLSGPLFQDQLYVRFGGWLFNYISFKLFGISETTFILPTWIISSTLGVICYFILLLWRYSVTQAFLGGLFLASAPFEILTGTVRSNDLFLGWALAMSLLFFVLYEQKPVRQGILLAIFLWFGFYVKLWVVYVLPALGLYYLFQILRKEIWGGVISFSATSLFLHGITTIFWKIKTGLFFPFIAYHAATYPVPATEFGRLFLQYPKMIFQGSEFGTTLFGIVPYLLLILLSVKIILSLFPERFPDHLRLDQIDLYLFVYWGSFFVLFNFFPSSFKFDQYYSPGRIFRYLTPLSFPMTLHLAKLLLDFSKISLKVPRLASHPALGSMVLVPLILINIYQADNATKPGQIYRRIMLSIIKDMKELSPPKLLASSHVASWLKDLYLKEENNKRPFIPILQGIYSTPDHEKWLEENQPALPDGTLLITGLVSYVHYGANYNNGFRLAQFSRPLDPHWKLVKEYGMISYLPDPEPARLWRLEGKITAIKSEPPPPKEDLSRIKNVKNFDTLFKTGMDYFGKNDCTKARAYFKKIIQDFPERADDAFFFYAVCYFREGAWERTIAEFKNLIEKNPKSRWVPGAHYHMGVSYKELGNMEQARKEFQYVIDNFPGDTSTVNLSKMQLKELPGGSVGIIERLYKKFFPNK